MPAPSLREAQLRFASALFDDDDAPVRSLVREEDVPAAGRLDIHRHNLREGFTRALALTFPVIERLVGEGCFGQLALDFLKAHPSRSGNLHHIGAPFPSFLRERFAGSGHECFADVAALEWACEQALIAPRAQAVPAGLFRTLDAANGEALAFELEPSCAFVSSRFPIVRIWRDNQPGATSTDTIDLTSGADHVLVMRSDEGVALHSLRQPAFILFEALGRGIALGAALDLALACDPGFDFTAAFHQLVALRIVTGVRPLAD